MITEDYVSFETAKLLKEKAFDEPTRMFYEVSNYPSNTTKENFKKITGRDMEQIEIHSLYGLEDEPFFNSVEGKDENQVACPTLQMTMKWLREEKGFHIFAPLEIDYDEDERGDKWYHDAAYYPEIIRVSDGKIMYDDGSLYAEPEQACEAAIKYCLENLI